MQDIAGGCHGGRCGTRPFAVCIRPDGVPLVALNLRCVDGIDLAALTTTPVDGRKI